MSVFQVSLDELHARLACLSCYHMVGKTKQTVQRKLNIFTRHKKGGGGGKKKKRRDEGRNKITSSFELTNDNNAIQKDDSYTENIVYRS